MVKKSLDEPLFRCNGVTNTAILDKMKDKSYSFYLNGPVKATKSFVCLALYNIQSQTHNVQNILRTAKRKLQF